MDWEVGIGIHTLLIVVWLLSHVRLLCDPMNNSPPGSSVHEIFQARTLEWVVICLKLAFNLALFFGRAPTGLLTFFWDCHSGTEFKTIRNLTYLYLEKSSSGTMPADGDYGGDVALVYLLHPSH